MGVPSKVDLISVPCSWLLLLPLPELLLELLELLLSELLLPPTAVCLRTAAHAEVPRCGARRRDT